MSISIPKPCSEDRLQMTPGAEGSFCHRCCKTVYDLTSKSTGEIIELISQTGKICGIVRTVQLAPVSVTPGIHGRLRTFTRALMLVFGAALFSCSNNDPSTVGEVTVDPADTVSMHNHADTAAEKNATPLDTVSQTASQDTTGKPKQTAGQPGQQTGTQQDEQQPVRPKHNPLPLEPRWNGGSYNATQEEIKKRVKYPAQAKQNNITGTVWVDFIVKADGETTGFKVRQGLGYGCDEEAIRVIKSLGKWEPGKMGGKTADMEYSVGVPFGE